MQARVAVRTEETLTLMKVLISKKVEQYLEMGIGSELDLPLDEQSWWLFKAALYSIQLENSYLFVPTKADKREFERLHQVTPSVSA